MPLGLTALPRSLLGHIAQEVEWGDGHRDALTSLWIKKHSNPKRMKTSDNQQPSGDKQRVSKLVTWYIEALQRALDLI
ncbi:MAG: hypothetical protein RQ885_03660 [Desulfurococcales archaeon]|nr:hypothetical protein [Desulfurococcales archaeon]